MGADDAGGKHIRKRLWLVADASKNRCNGPTKISLKHEKIHRWRPPDGLVKMSPTKFRRTKFNTDDLRTLNGVAFGVDRIERLGNGQVPICMALAWTILVGGN